MTSEKWRPIAVAQAAAGMRRALEARDGRLEFVYAHQAARALWRTDPANEAEFERLLAPPGSTGDRRYDVFLAAGVEWVLLELGREVPDWCDVEPLVPEWAAGVNAEVDGPDGPGAHWAAVLREQTPASILARGVISRPRDWEDFPDVLALRRVRNPEWDG